MKVNSKVRDKLKLKDEQGITLATLAIYVISVLIALAILATVTAYFRSNFQELNNRSTDIAEFDRFNLYFLEEVKRTGNDIVNPVTGSIIEFTSGNRYEFVSSDKAIYLVNAEKRIKIAERVNSCTFTTETENEKTIIKVNITIIDNDSRKVEYVMGYENNYIANENEVDYITGWTKTYEYTETVQTFTAVVPGTYKLEVWGAQGRAIANQSSNPHRGGYASGIIKLEKDDVLYIYVGGSPIANGGSTMGGWNGGGGTGAGTINTIDSGNGGGATDICTIPSEMTQNTTTMRWERSLNSYNSRIIVAGGSSGGRSSGIRGEGDGGGAGGVGANKKDVVGTQTGVGSATETGNLAPASFGLGGSTVASTDDRAAAGGGWYGGKTLNQDNWAGGGSNYVLTAGSYRPSGYIFQAGHSYEMSDVVMLAGNESGMPTHDGESTMTGNAGNGYARITLMGS